MLNSSSYSYLLWTKQLISLHPWASCVQCNLGLPITACPTELLLLAVLDLLSVCVLCMWSIQVPIYYKCLNCVLVLSFAHTRILVCFLCHGVVCLMFCRFYSPHTCILLCCVYKHLTAANMKYQGSSLSGLRCLQFRTFHLIFILFIYFVQISPLQNLLLLILKILALYDWMRVDFSLYRQM